MRIITINLSEPHVKALEMLQELGLYPSRSEAIRVAIRDFLQKEIGFQQKFEEFEIKPKNVLNNPEKKKEIERILQKLKKDQQEVLEHANSNG